MTVVDPVVVINTIKAKNGGSFPVVEAVDVAGGVQQFEDTDERDAFPFEKTTVNMLCLVGNAGGAAMYRCTAVGDDETPSTWELYDAPVNASAVLVEADAEVPNGRTIAVSSDLTKTDAGAGSTLTFGLANAGAGAATTSNPDAIQTDIKGRVVAVTAGVVKAPASATFVVMSTDPTLANERALLVAAGELDAVDAGPGASVTLGLPDIGTAGAFANPDTFTTDQWGRVTAATAGAAKALASSPFVTIGAVAGLTAERALGVTSGHLTLLDGGANSSVTLGLPEVGPGAGAIANPDSFTLDVQGRVTAATAGVAKAPLASSYVVVGVDATLTNERALAVSSDLSLTDGGAGSALTLGVTDAGAGAGSYANPDSLTLDAKGRVTAVTVGSAKALASEAFVTIGNTSGLASERALAVTSGHLSMSDGGAGASVTLGLPSVGPGAGAIAAPSSITLDAQGRVTAAVAGSAPAGTAMTYLTATTEAGLTNSRLIAVASGELTKTDGGAGSTMTFGLANAGTAGTYAYPTSLTTDAFGRVTSVTGGSPTSSSSTVLSNQDTSGAAVGSVVYLSDYSTWSKAQSDGTQTKAIVAGICLAVDASLGTVILSGRAVVKFTDDGNQPEVNAECWLAAAADDSGTGAGKATATPPTSGYLAALGVVLDNSNYSVDKTCVVAFARAPLAIA